jgi:hypothetical protein
MPASSLVTDYLGRGLLSARPSNPNVPVGSSAYYHATDVKRMYGWDGSAWQGVNGLEATLTKPLVADFSTQNMGSVTPTNGTGGIIINNLNGYTTGWAFMYKTPPAAPYSIYAKWRPTFASAINFSQMGLMLYNSTSGRNESLQNYSQASAPNWQYALQRWSSISAYNSNIALAGIASPTPWLRMDVTSTQWTAFISANGWDWYQGSTTAFSGYLTATGGTVDRVGFGTTVAGASAELSIVLEHFSFTAPL